MQQKKSSSQAPESGPGALSHRLVGPRRGRKDANGSSMFHGKLVVVFGHGLERADGQ